MKLTVVASEGMSDWWCIERAEHDGRMWLEPIGEGGAALCCSSRFSDADVEGDASEMHAIADAIEARRGFSAKRCAVDVAGDHAVPLAVARRPERHRVTLAEADELAALIRSTVPRAEG